ncbi:MAG: sulfotransferase [Betaproteobacteria bacterium]
MADYTFIASRAPADRHVRGYLLVVSHMRSLSSVLCHILGSNAEVAGYSELHQAYRGRNSLRELERRVAAATDAPVSGRYVLDKVLHNNLEIDDGVLVRPDVRVLYLLRRPEKAIASMLDLSDATKGTPGDTDPELVVRYYCDRLDSLARYSLHTQGRSAFVESERLVAEPEAVLDGLADWLALSAPLSRAYRTFKFTGMLRHGDPTGAILSGRLEPELARRKPADTIAPIPDTAMARAVSAWTACRDALIERCRTL